MDRKLNSKIMKMLIAIPRDFVGAISVRNSGATTVSPPIPRPDQIRAKYNRPRIPEANTCMKRPLAQRRLNPCQQRSRPKRSVTTRASPAPIAVPRTPNELMLLSTLARPFGLCFHSVELGDRPKSSTKLGRPIDALKPPSS